MKTTFHLRACYTIALAAALMSPTLSLAFNIDPFSTQDARPNEHAFISQISNAVHEDQTEAAIRLLPKQFTPAPSNLLCRTARIASDRSIPRRGDDPIIRGIWWPDDPNQLLPRSFGKWLLWMNDGMNISKNGKDWRSRSVSIGPDYFMNYRGHFGDMQQIHAMANKDGEAAHETRTRILAWAEFTYLVATCHIQPANRISKLSIASMFPRKAGWTIRHVFNPSRKSGSKQIPELAAGALLHLIQDSYSASHVNRTYGASVDCPTGRIVQFHSYVNQSVFSHVKADSYGAWRPADTPAAESPPVLASAKMLSLIRNNADWTSVVYPHLVQSIFCLDSDAKPSNSGGY